jgi:hypothetical protein
VADLTTLKVILVLNLSPLLELERRPFTLLFIHLFFFLQFLDIYDGVAPNGKVAFVDLAVDNSITGLSARELILPGYNAGARVFSNSWGSFFQGNGYYAANDVDTYLYDHKVEIDFVSSSDFLIE